jgi:hypothetical protein
MTNPTIDGVSRRPMTATDLATFVFLKARSLLVIGMCSLILIFQEGCAAMPANSATNDELRFRTHVMYAQRYSASQMQVIYGNHLIYTSIFPEGHPPELIRAKTPADEKRDRAGGYGGLRAFEDPLQVKWHSLDGEPHEAVLNLEDIFKGRVVLHREDPASIDSGMPMSTSGPTIVVEVDDRTLNIYMDVHIYLRPAPNERVRGDHRNRTLAYSKTF